MNPEWKLEWFDDRLDDWAAQENPPSELIMVVAHWVLSRFDDPYLGVQREPNFANLWFGAVPGSRHGDGQVVVCSYWIKESTRTVQCNSFATLNLPL